MQTEEYDGRSVIEKLNDQLWALKDKPTCAGVWGQQLKGQDALAHHGDQTHIS